MKANGRRVGLIFLGLVCLGLATLVLLTWRAVRQERLNRALILAVKGNDDRAVVTLLNEGARANCRDEPPRNFSLWQTLTQVVRGWRSSLFHAPTPLLIALEPRELPYSHDIFFLPGNVLLVRALLDHGADPNARDAEGQTALWVMHDMPNPDVVTSLLIRHRADVNIPLPGSEGRTLLMDAARWGYAAHIDLLMHAGAHINAQNPDGETALIYAVDTCRSDNVDTLLKHHADPNIKERDGKTALTIAERSLAGHYATPFNHEYVDEEWREIVRLLKAAGAKR